MGEEEGEKEEKEEEPWWLTSGFEKEEGGARLEEGQGGREGGGEGGGVRLEAMLLRICYPVSGTNRPCCYAYAAQCPVLAAAMLLHICYEVSGTDVGYAASRFGGARRQYKARSHPLHCRIKHTQPPFPYNLHRPKSIARNCLFRTI
eukprot:1888055-Rhodomonas_salina.2